MRVLLVQSALLWTVSSFVLQSRSFNLHSSLFLTPNGETMAKSKKPKFYAVAVGKATGIYNTWADCEKQTKGFSGARFKSFSTRGEAEDFIRLNSSKPTHASEAPDVKRRKLGDTAVLCWMAIEMYFDGGSRGNPGVAGSGATIFVTTPESATREKTEVRMYLGTKATNNEAEYQGLIAGLLEAKEAAMVALNDRTGMGIRLSIKGDSDLIIRQMQGTYKVNSAGLKSLHSRAKAILDEIESLAPALVVELQHVYRKDNKEADQLANEAMDTRKSWKTTASSSDDTMQDSPDQVVLEDV